MQLSGFLIGIGAPVAYHPGLAPVLGGVKETIFLCQLIYWVGKQHDADGWIYKTQKELEAETGLSRQEQETARKNLRRRGFLVEKQAGVPKKLYYRVEVDRLNEVWVEHSHSRVPKSRTLECLNPALLSEGIPHSLQSEITSENTTDTNVDLATNGRPPSKSKDVEAARIDAEFEEDWQVYPRKEGKSKAREKYRERRKKISRDELVRAVERYVAKVKKENRETRHIQNGGTFFNSGYEDYLDENYQDNSPPVHARGMFVPWEKLEKGRGEENEQHPGT